MLLRALLTGVLVSIVSILVAACEAPTPTSTAIPSPTPTFAPSPISTATPTPTPTPTTITANMRYTTRREIAGVNWSGGQGVSLSTLRPATIKKEPSCSQALYGIMTIGSMAVIPLAVCPMESWSGTVYFDLNGNGDLTDETPHSYGRGPQPIVELSLQYPEGKQSYAFSFGVNTNLQYPTKEATPAPAPFAKESSPPGGTPTPTPASPKEVPPPEALRGDLQYFTYNIRVGFLLLPQPIPVALIDANNNGLFNDMADDRIVIDLDGDGFADGSAQSFDLGQEQFTLETAIYLAATPLSPLKVGEVSQSGNTLTLEKARTGQLAGIVLGADTGAPLAGAKVLVKPGNVEATTDAAGRYSLTLAEGFVSQVLFTMDGYVPTLEKKQRYTIRPGSATTANYTLRPASKVKSGTLTLRQGFSYSFVEGAQANWGEGDFQLSWGGPQNFYIDTQPVYGQVGTIDLGPQGTTPLEQISPPTTGYQPYSTFVQLNSVYVIKARLGQEGHYIILRVTKIVEQEITFDWLYK